MAKVSQQVLMSPPEKEDIVALAIVRRESQAEVARQAIAAALPGLKASHGAALGELYRVLDEMGVDRMEALREMSTVRLRPDGTRRALSITDLRTADGRWRVNFPWPANRRVV